jgi:hypothetical protein
MVAPGSVKRELTNGRSLIQRHVNGHSYALPSARKLSGTFRALPSRQPTATNSCLEAPHRRTSYPSIKLAMYAAGQPHLRTPRILTYRNWRTHRNVSSSQTPATPSARSRHARYNWTPLSPQLNSAVCRSCWGEKAGRQTAYLRSHLWLGPSITNPGSFCDIITYRRKQPPQQCAACRPAGSTSFVLEPTVTTITTPCMLRRAARGNLFPRRASSQPSRSAENLSAMQGRCTCQPHRKTAVHGQ